MSFREAEGNECDRRIEGKPPIRETLKGRNEGKLQMDLRFGGLLQLPE